MHVQLIAVPYDSARRGERMGAGPEALLEAGLVDRLGDAGHLADVQIIDAPQEKWRAEVRTAFDLAHAVSRAVTDAISGGAFPLVLSGNCGPAAVGCAAGLRDVRAVFWFDPHGDFNTPDSTIGGFLDGMALATLTGRCWPQLAAAIPGFVPVREDSVVLLGAQDLDPLEAVALEASAIRRVRRADLRTRLSGVVSDLPAGPGRAYLHLDLDVLDPSEGRINSYAAPGGFSQPDVEWAISTIDEFPLVEVNYHEAEAFCRKLTDLGHASGVLPADWVFRLPTEAQWEYAARAGTTTATSFGAGLSSRQANFRGEMPYNGAEPGPFVTRATPAGRYPANAWGLHDMHGNVFEWCRDWYHARLPGGVDPDLSARQGEPNRDGTFSRVRRGGAWNDEGKFCRSALRLRYEPPRRSDHIGFRVVAVRAPGIMALP